jgi:hypothetical protein
MLQYCLHICGWPVVNYIAQDEHCRVFDWLGFKVVDCSRTCRLYPICACTEVTMRRKNKHGCLL